MDLTSDQIAEIEAKLRQLEELDPADLPGPAAELVVLLGEILDESDQG
ncbi:MAG: hypothetical protein WAL25_10510 [Acidimicrobiia bacterium]